MTPERKYLSQILKPTLERYFKDKPFTIEQVRKCLIESRGFHTTPLDIGRRLSYMVQAPINYLWRYPGRRYGFAEPTPEQRAIARAERGTWLQECSLAYSRRQSVRKARRDRREAELRAGADARYAAIKARHMAKRQAREARKVRALVAGL